MSWYPVKPTNQPTNQPTKYFLSVRNALYNITNEYTKFIIMK